MSDRFPAPRQPAPVLHHTVQAIVPADAVDLAGMAAQLEAEEGGRQRRFTAERILEDGFGPHRAFDGAIARTADGAALGYALWHPAYATDWAMRGLFVLDLYVRPDARRGGLGRALLGAAARAAKAAGVEFLWWTSRAENAQAQAFYATLQTLAEPVCAHAVAFEDLDRLAAATPA